MSKKDVAYKIRVQKGLRAEFLEACREMDRPAAQVLRDYMRSFVAQSRTNRSGDLFAEHPGSDMPNTDKHEQL